MNSFDPAQDYSDPAYDPFADAIANLGDQLEPYAALPALREKGGVHEMDYRELLGEAPSSAFPPGMRRFIVIGHEEMHEVLRHPEIFSSGALKKSVGLAFGEDVLVAMDPPEHPKYRKIFQQQLLPQYVGKWGDKYFDHIIHDLIAKFSARGSADLVTEYTEKYPFLTIFEMLQVPESDRHVVHRLAVGQLNYHLSPDKAIEAGTKLGQYFLGVIRARRANPGDDLISIFAQSEVDGEKLPEQVLVSFLRLLIFAGGDTTYKSSGSLLAMLLTTGQYQEVLEDRSLLPKAIDEILRWDTPANTIHRIAIQDTVLGGVAIPAGSFVLGHLVAANRDPHYFPDPDRFDIHRSTQARALRFGGGAHVCIGQHLARLEMTRAVTAVMHSLPNLRLDPDKPPPEIRGSELRGPAHVYVRFG